MLILQMNQEWAFAIARWAAIVVVGAVCIWLVFGITFGAIFAVVQEYKIWKPKSLPSLNLWGAVKVFIFNLIWMGVAMLGTIFVLLKYVLTLGQSDMARDAHCLGERFTAYVAICFIVGRVDIRGATNLPPDDHVSDNDESSNYQKQVPAPVYVANHASQIDAGVVYFLRRRFKWISKDSVKFLPGVGQIMALSQHVFIDRKKGKNMKSVSNLFEKSDEAVQSGIPMFFFPQGTRRMDTRLPFKDGAFIVATKNKSPIIPISIDIPRNAWNSVYPLNLLWMGKAPVVTITVHKPIVVTEDSDMENLKTRCMDTIYSAVPTILEAEAPVSDTTPLNATISV